VQKEKKRGKFKRFKERVRYINRRIEKRLRQMERQTDGIQIPGKPH
jgi:hypothetical protein